ncbi:MAG: histidinol-phosphatase HisJ family protein [Firmicutes bacterium]|nr:histidinol-phosphatase HisJ family protein [Bacillota bacterium]
MYDFHMHTTVSFDGVGTAREMAEAAAARGLKEICFTDHLDYYLKEPVEKYTFTTEDYNRAYDQLEVPGLVIRHGFEFGMTTWNKAQLSADLQRRQFDFVLGSVHTVNDQDAYIPEYWQGRTVQEAFEVYLKEVLACVKVHDEYDVLGHLNYVCKSPNNPTHEPLRYEDYREIVDEILKELVRKGKGMEINTSGIDRAGVFLPSAEFLRRFKELGGEIVTVGSDAHRPENVGKYIPEALEVLKEVFGYVCTFEDRKPVFHRL